MAQVKSQTFVPTRRFSPESKRPTAPAEELVKVVENRRVSHEYMHLSVVGSARVASGAAGQFYQLECPQGKGERSFLRRPMSCYKSDSANNRVEFLYKIQGAGTRNLARLQAGDVFQILGPLGNGYYLNPRWSHIVVVGRGAGLATLAPLAEAAACAGISVHAVLSARTRDVILAEERFRRTGATVTIVTDEAGNSSPHHMSCLLRDVVETNRCDAFFTCGSVRILEVIKALSEQYGIPGQVALEQQMACGLGMCFCCVRNVLSDGKIVSKKVCVDGPVFDIKEIGAW